jgi:hypothetical protein
MAKWSSGIAEAKRALRLRKGPPADGDRPPPTPFPGRKVKLIPGQLDLDGVQHGEPPEPECDEDEAA